VWKSQVLGQKEINCVALSPPNNLVAWVARWCIGLIDAISGKMIIIQSFDVEPVQTCLAWAADRSQLLTCEANGIVRLWDAVSVRSVNEVKLLYQWSILHFTSFCSFYDGHRYIVTDHGLFLIPPQHRP
jgi:WD40 repeat protein